MVEFANRGPRVMSKKANKSVIAQISKGNQAAFVIYYNRVRALPRDDFSQTAMEKARWRRH